MIDIHSHILAEIDDGARSLEESLEMCRLSADDGVTIIVATPHAHDGVHTTHEPTLLREKVDELNQKLGGNPRVELGSELRFNHDIVRQTCSESGSLAIASGPYVLVEFPHQLVPPGSERVLFEMLSHQIRPIIAHPERNAMLMAEPERFYQLVEMGVLGQVDAGSLLGQFGKPVERTARIMLEHGLVHFVASDCHNTRNRVPGLSKASEIIAEAAGREVAEAMTTSNPAAVIEGQPIKHRPAPVPVRRHRRWLRFGR